MTVSEYSHLKRSAPQAELRGWGRPGSSFLTIRCFILMLIHFLPNCELSLEGGGPTHFLRLARQMVTEAEDGEDRWAQRSPPLGRLLALSGILCICEMQITDRPHFDRCCYYFCNRLIYPSPNCEFLEERALFTHF